MSIVVKAGGEYENHPEGQFRAICMDVIDLGEVENKKWGKMQHKIAIVFHSEEKNKDGKPFEVWERFTASLDEKAHLLRFLQSWRGKAFSQEELLGFDVEKLVGANAYIQIIHNQSGAKTYANIGSIMLPPKGSPKLAPTAGYERRKDRKPEVSKTPEPAMAQRTGPDRTIDWEEDDDLPF